MASGSRRLDGRVAVVTGAGRGLGRAHAHALARLGAHVVVNDLGVALDGSGADASVAAGVAAELLDAGCSAVADTTDIASIAGGRQLIERVLDRFGRVDVVINNAGFGGGVASIATLEEARLDALLDVHVKATLGTMSAAIVPMRAAGYGRIVNTVSEASLDPRFVASIGYAVAKAGVWAATLATATEVDGTGVTVNAISPGARTRMSATALDAGFRDGASSQLDLAPEHVATVVAYLASPAAADINGRIIHAASGAVREYETRRSAGTELVRRLQRELGLR